MRLKRLVLASLIATGLSGVASASASAGVFAWVDIEKTAIGSCYLGSNCASVKAYPMATGTTGITYLPGAYVVKARIKEPAGSFGPDYNTCAFTHPLQTECTTPAQSPSGKREKLVLVGDEVCYDILGELQNVQGTVATHNSSYCTAIYP